MKRIKDDTGAAITIMGLYAVMVLFILGGLLIDVNKNTAARTQFVNLGEISAKAAIKHQTGKGGLNDKSGLSAVEFYRKEVKTKDFAVYTGLCQADKYPIIKVGYKKSINSPVTIQKTFHPKTSLVYTEAEKRSINQGNFQSIELDITDCTRDMYSRGDSLVKFKANATTIRGNNGQQ